MYFFFLHRIWEELNSIVFTNEEIMIHQYLFKEHIFYFGKETPVTEKLHLFKKIDVEV